MTSLHSQTRHDMIEVGARLSPSERRLNKMRSSLEDELRQGLFGADEYQVIAGRLDKLRQIHGEIQSLLPLAKGLL